MYQCIVIYSDDNTFLCTNSRYAHMSRKATVRYPLYINKKIFLDHTQNNLKLKKLLHPRINKF
jgi:hypothetical protein